MLDVEKANEMLNLPPKAAPKITDWRRNWLRVLYVDVIESLRIYNDTLENRNTKATASLISLFFLWSAGIAWYPTWFVGLPLAIFFLVRRHARGLARVARYECLLLWPSLAAMLAWEGERKTISCSKYMVDGQFFVDEERDTLFDALMHILKAQVKDVDDLDMRVKMIILADLRVGRKFALQLAGCVKTLELVDESQFQ